jgi:ribosome recycling factor
MPLGKQLTLGRERLTIERFFSSYTHMSNSDPRIQSFNVNVEKVLKHLSGEFAKLQTGRANAALVEHIEVDAYGSRQPLKNVAGISVPEPRMIVIQPWDKGVLQSVEKAIQMANIGINPVNDGVVIRLALPPMNQERREQLSKLVHQLAEESRISVRKYRQEAHDVIKQDKDEDVKSTMTEFLQKAVDIANEKIADLAKRKEEEIMTV